MKYCTEESMQVYPGIPRAPGKEQEFPCMLAVCMSGCPSVACPAGSPKSCHSPGSQVAGEPPFLFPCSQVPGVYSAVCFYLDTNCIYFCSPPPCFFSCIAQQAAAAGTEGTFPGLFEWGDANCSRRSILQCCAKLLWGELCALYYIHSLSFNAGTRKVILSFKGCELPNLLEAISS